MESSYLTLNEMAELLRRTPRQFRADIARRKIPHIQLGRIKLFDRDEVIEHLKGLTVELPRKQQVATSNVRGGRFAARLGL